MTTTHRQRQSLRAVETALAIAGRVGTLPAKTQRRLRFEPLQVALIVDMLRDLTSGQAPAPSPILPAQTAEAMAVLRARHNKAVKSGKPVALSGFEALALAALLVDAASVAASQEAA